MIASPGAVFRAAALAALVLLAARPAAAQEEEVQLGGLLVVVQDEESSLPVPFAHVQIDGARWMNASVEGALLRPAAPGQHRVTVRAPGYELRSFLVTMGEDAAGMVRVPLTRTPVVLDSIHVSVARTEELRDFYRRASTSPLGRFLTREQMEKMESRRFTDMLRRVPGVRVVDGTPRSLVVGTTAGIPPAPCRPTYFLNGMPFMVQDPDSEFRIERIEGVEVYSRAGFIPAQFSGVRSCAVISVWTR